MKQKYKLITVEEALVLLDNSIELNQSESVNTAQSLGAVLSDDVISPIDMPPFPQSAMDGYAVNYINGQSDYELIGEIAAGASGLEYELLPGQAVRIFTGAPVPLTANVVIKQEIVERITDQKISVQESVKAGENIRPKGEQIQQGILALEKGSVLTPASIGFLCGIGVDRIQIVKQPKIAIIATGSELVKPGVNLPYGKIYESNTYMLAAALSNYGYYNHTIQNVEDNYQQTRDEIEKALNNNDLLILSGGISVGDYDFVGKALLELGVVEIFYKVKQKPGKPLFFGKKGNKYVLALPGNPAAAMTSFYIYVLRLLNKMSGKLQGLKTGTGYLKMPYHKKGDRAQFLKAKLEAGKIEILDGQSSAMLRSFAQANCLVYVPAERSIIDEQEEVKVYLID